MVTKPPIPLPYYSKADVVAIKALQRGDATPDQQKRGLDWIIQHACLTYDFSNKPESDRLSAIFDGRRFAGLQIVKLCNGNISTMKFNEEAKNGRK